MVRRGVGEVQADRVGFSLSAKRKIENRGSERFVFFADSASHYHGAAGSEKEIRKNGREGIFI